MDRFKLGLAAGLLLVITASHPGFKRHEAMAQDANGPTARKINLGAEQRPTFRVSGLPQYGEIMLSGDWARR